MEQHPNHSPEDEPHSPDQRPADEVHFDDTPLEQITADLRMAFARAEVRGETITGQDAQAVANLLALLLGDAPEMAHFAETGDVNLVALHEECQRIYSRTWPTPEVGPWIQRLEHDLASRTDLGQHTERPPAGDQPPDNTLIAQGMAEHGNAFQAYLTLPDIDRRRDDLLETFREFYVGSYASMDTLLDELTEVLNWENILDNFADKHGIEGLVSLDRNKVERIARETWDIVEIGARYYVFDK